MAGLGIIIWARGNAHGHLAAIDYHAERGVKEYVRSNRVNKVACLGKQDMEEAHNRLIPRVIHACGVYLHFCARPGDLQVPDKLDGPVRVKIRWKGSALFVAHVLICD